MNHETIIYKPITRWLFILRGLPGSGKSTYAKRLQNKYHLLGGFSSVICSTDFYFTRPDGIYDWNFKLLKEAHQWCFNQVVQAMSDNIDYGDCTLVILDNTNLAKWEFENYLQLAKENNYTVKIKTIGEFTDEKLEEYAKRNVHKVSLETIKKMRDKYERYQYENHT